MFRGLAADPAPSDTLAIRISVPSSAVSTSQRPASWHGVPVRACEVPITDA